MQNSMLTINFFMATVGIHLRMQKLSASEQQSLLAWQETLHEQRLLAESREKTSQCPVPSGSSQHCVMPTSAQVLGSVYIIKLSLQ